MDNGERTYTPGNWRGIMNLLRRGALSAGLDACQTIETELRGAHGDTPLTIEFGEDAERTLVDSAAETLRFSQVSAAGVPAGAPG